MKRFYLLLAFTLFIPACLPAQGDEYTWRPLFGADMAEAAFNPEAWSVTDGTLTATKDEAVWTTVEYGNFELDLEFKNDAGTNSGIVVYCTDTADWIPNSVEIQLADDYYEKWKDSKPYERCGAIYGHLAPREDKVVKEPGEWNHIRVRCTGQRIAVILNGRKVTEMDMSKWTSGTINPDGSEIPAWLPKPFADLPAKGYIGLQGKHGNAGIRFRNIKIRDVK